MSLDIGQVLGGKFLIERLVGRGTMGCVWQARDQGNQQRIAIRLIQPEFDSEQVAAYSEADGRRTGQLSNRHITTQLNVGFLPTGERCILSEFVDGETLKSRVASKGPLSELEVAQLLVHVLEGLDAAHEAGVIHRDLTPRSIMLVPVAGGDGHVAQIIDFGISRLQALLGNQSAALAAGIDTSSLQYLAPEQLNGLRDIDPRSNIYSLGVIAYEAITGRRPFEGRDFGDPSVAVLGEEPTPVEELAPESSSPFAQLIRKAMSRSPNARFQHAEEMIGAIINWATRAGITQAQLEAGIGTVHKRVVVPFLTQEPGAELTAPAARLAPPAMPVPGPAPAAAEPVSTPAAASPTAAAPISAFTPPASAPVQVAVPAPAVAAALKPAVAPASTQVSPAPAAEGAPPLGAAPDIFGAPPAADIDQAHVDALFGAPPVSARSEPQVSGANEWAPPVAAPPEPGSSPIAQGGALVAPTLSQNNWQAALETMPRGGLQPPPYGVAGVALLTGTEAQPSSLATPALAPPQTEQPVWPGAAVATEALAVAPAVAGPVPAAVVQDRATPPQILLEMTTQRQTEPPGALPAELGSSPVAVAPPIAPPTDLAGAGTPAYGTPAIQPGPAMAPQEVVPQAAAAPELATEQAIRDKRTILGIGGVAGVPAYPAAASAVVVPSVDGNSQRPQQMTAPGIQPGDAAQGQGAPAAQSAPAAVTALQQQSKVATEPIAAPAAAALALPSPYGSPYAGAPQRSKKRLLIGVGLVAVVGIVAAIALSQGKAEPEVRAPAAASQSAPVPRTFEPQPPGPVAAAIAAASARAEASGKEPPASNSKSGASLSQAVNAGLMSQSVAPSQKSAKPIPSTKPPPSATKPPPAAKPVAAAKPASAAAPTPAKPISKPAPAGDPYNYR